MIFDQHAPITGYEALADYYRNRIESGDIPPGSRFPSERDLQQEHGLARDTVRLAFAVLRFEGLIVVRHGHATRVREIHEKQMITLEPGQRVSIRMPTPRERRERDIPEGVPVFVIVDEHGAGDLLPGDRVDIISPPATGPSPA